MYLHDAVNHELLWWWYVMCPSQASRSLLGARKKLQCVLLEKSKTKKKQKTTINQIVLCVNKLHAVIPLSMNILTFSGYTKFDDFLKS